jgi:hypothetical protein
MLQLLVIDNYFHGVSFEGPKNAVFWDVFMKVTTVNVFWYITPCESGKNRRFGGTHRFHLQCNETLEFIKLAARICLTTDGEESLLQRQLHNREYHLP